MLIDDLAHMILKETYKITINSEKLIKSAVFEQIKLSGGIAMMVPLIMCRGFYVEVCIGPLVLIGLLAV